jgi:hypothetical protein
MTVSGVIPSAKPYKPARALPQCASQIIPNLVIVMKEFEISSSPLIPLLRSTEERVSRLGIDTLAPSDGERD